MSFTSGPYVPEAQRVLQDDAEGIPTNTTRAYCTKGKEFEAFCDIVHSRDQYPKTVTEEKVFIFLFYQAHRPSRQKGKRMRDRPIFDLEEFEVVRERARQGYKEPNPVGYEVVNQHLCAILKIHRRQVDLSSNNLTKDQLRSERVQVLLKSVKMRKRRVAKENYAEKIDSEFAPFLLVRSVPLIEEKLFDRNAFAPSYSMASLRDRYCFLMSHCGVLRGESLFKCELSDLCDLVMDDQGPHPCHILMMRIATGKTNGLKVLYGRVMRHKNVSMCAIGALGLYLLSRFDLTGEVFDFTSNESWYNVKLLIDSTYHDVESSVSDQAYAKAIRKVCEELKIVSKHFVHFGRAVGAVHAELSELPSSDIKILGNWNPDVQEDRYSSKVPVPSLRLMAGHELKKGMFYLPRGSLSPPTELLIRIFPFIEESRESFNHLSRPTASVFLDLLERLREVVIQDAAMLISMGRKHAVLHLPVFQSQMFYEYRMKMERHLEESISSDPAETSMESAMPGVSRRFSNLHASLKTGVMAIKEDVASVHSKLAIMPTLQHIQEYLNHAATYTFNGTTAATPTEEMEIPGAVPRPPRPLHSLVKRHSSITNMWKEWFGVPPYSVSIDELERNSKVWRQHFKSADQKHFSRTKYVIKHVRDLVAGGSAIDAVLADMDQRMAQHKSLSTLEKHLKNDHNG
jgi:hypothetical protein